MTATTGQIDFPLTQNEMIDHDHGEFAVQLAGYQSLPDAELATALDQALNHFKSHFAREEALMEETGFPPTPIHKNEHQRVIDWTRAVRAGLLKGDVEMARTFLNKEIVNWFINHAATMDTATANWAAGRGLKI